MEINAAPRGNWASRIGFVLAAAGSAVGLGNIWRFPYVTGENGGGLFVLVYLGAIVLVGLPIMVAEIMIGRMSQRSTVTAFKTLAGRRSPWVGLGWMGVGAAFFILSFYAVVAGWALHYVAVSLGGGIAGRSPEEIQQMFVTLHADAGLNLTWTAIFMALTTAVVWGGVQSGIERWSRILMPALFILLVALLVRAATLPGFEEGIAFVFGFHAEQLSPGGVLEAMGQAFFSLSLGMGGLLTYGSYLRRDDDIVGNAISVTLLDTTIALLACAMLFPVIFTYGMEPEAGPGLIFENIPIAFSQMPGGSVLATLFFALLVFAALTSSISLLEVVTAYFIDDRGWPRSRATLFGGIGITLLAIPAALTGSTHLFGAGMQEHLGRNWFDLVDNFASNWILPAGGLGMALFIGWKVREQERHLEFVTGNRLAPLYRGWLLVLRFVVPVAVIAVFLHAIRVF